MLNHPRRPFLNPAPDTVSKRMKLSFFILRRRLILLKWLVPVGLALAVILYELGPARWIHTTLGDTYHFVAEILVYGTVGPVMAFLLLDILGRWLEERETSELQTLILAQAREHARIDRELNDSVLQSLFAASVLLDSINASLPELPAEVAAHLQETNRALDETIQQLRAHLLSHASPKP
jgi:signal transduction histidine kinase